MPTDSFFGKYRLIERLGFGGMAEVFRAVLTGAEGFYRELAIKRIRPELTGNPDFERMFIDEARIAAKLQHANITQIFDFDRIGNFTYIVMEYVRGQDLASVLSRGRQRDNPLPVDVACHVAIEFLTGLRYAHEKTEGGTSLGIVHRDLSPGNVLVSYEGEVKLTDFGIAKAIISITQTRTGEMKGKYSYMSPEQVRQQPLDQRSDLFSVGTVVYEMLTCERAFRDESDFKTLERIVNGDLRPMRAIRPEIPPELERLVAKATSVNPDERFQNAAEMLRAIEDCCRQVGIHTSSEALRQYLRTLFPDEISKEPEIFFGKYRLVERLGTGRKTEVYRAVLTGVEDFHQELALKRIRPGYAQDEELERLFLEAALAVPKLKHANIVQIYDVDRVGNFGYIAMEYVEGHRLAEVLDRAEKKHLVMPLPLAFHLIMEVLSGLRYAHEKREGSASLGIFHGDVCAANVLVSTEGEVRLVDFGLGNAFIPSASLDELATDYAHRSPEQMNQRGVDQRTDVFSTAALLFKLLTGARIFRDLTADEIRKSVVSTGRLRKEIPAEVLGDLGDLLARAMTADPGERPPTAAQLRLELFDLCRRAGLDPSAATLRDYALELFPVELPESVLEPTDAYSEATPDMREAPTPAQAHPRPARPPSPATKSDLPADLAASLPGGKKEPDEGKPAPDSFFPFSEAAGPGDAELTPVHRPSLGETIRPQAPARRRRWPLAIIVVFVAAAVVVVALLAWPGDDREPDKATGSGREVTVLMRSLPAIDAWYREHVFAPFEKKHNVRVRIVRYNTIDEVPSMLASSDVRLDLVKVHLALSKILFEQRLIVPVESVLLKAGRDDEVHELSTTLTPLALYLSRIRTAIENPICYLPRKLETNFIAYRPSKVSDAVRRWRSVRQQLEHDLTRLTDHGLPTGYELESDVQRWDSYDTLVLHYTWAHLPQGDGRTSPRVARRTYHYWGTLLEFMDDLAGTGLEGRLTLDASESTVDIFEWLALYRELGLYHPQVWSGEMNVTGSIIYDLLRRGEVFWAKVHSLAALELLGSPESGFPTTLPDPGDLAFSRMVKWVSLELSAEGRPARTGTHRAVTTGWLWGIPANAADPALSYDLASFITSREIHAREVATFSIQPVRKDVRFDKSRLGERLANVVEAQMKENRDRIVPRTKSIQEFRATTRVVFRAWEEIILERSYLEDGKISRRKIQRQLGKVFGEAGKP